MATRLTTAALAIGFVNDSLYPPSIQLTLPQLILYTSSVAPVSPGMDPVGDWNGMGCYT
jgi:hypothetical protein